MRFRLDSRTSPAKVILSVVACVFLAACGEDGSTSRSQEGGATEATDLGLEDQMVIAGRSSYLVLGGDADGSLVARLVGLDGGTPTVSDEWNVGSWDPDRRTRGDLDGREADDGSWIIGVQACSDGTTVISKCPDHRLALYRATPGEALADLGLHAEIASSFAVVGAAGDHVVLQSSVPEVTEPSRFWRFDQRSGELSPIDPTTDVQPSVRAGCVTGGMLAILDGFVRPAVTTTVTFVTLGDPRERQVVHVPLPSGENIYWMVCDSTAGVAVLSADPETRRLSAMRAAADGTVGPPDQIALRTDHDGSEFGPGTFAVVSAAALTPDEGARAVERGELPERKADVVVFHVNGGWRTEAIELNAGDRVVAAGDGRSLLVSRPGSTVVRIEPR